MALAKDISTPFGFDVSGAYHRIEQVRLESKTSMRFCVRAYADVSASAVVNAEFVAVYDLNGENPIRQAYLYLKTLPEFAGATDC